MRANGEARGLGAVSSMALAPDPAPLRSFLFPHHTDSSPLHTFVGLITPGFFSLNRFFG